MRPSAQSDCDIQNPRAREDAGVLVAIVVKVLAIVLAAVLNIVTFIVHMLVIEGSIMGCTVDLLGIAAFVATVLNIVVSVVGVVILGSRWLVVANVEATPPPPFPGPSPAEGRDALALVTSLRSAGALGRCR